MLPPTRPVEAVEHGRAPVHRPAGRLDRQDSCDLLREAHAVVVRVPDITDADRLLRTRVEIPLLPVEERVLRDRGGARQGEGTEDHHGSGTDCEAARTLGQSREQQQRDGQDDDAAAELAASGEERRRPTRAHQKCDHRRHGPARADRESDRQGEREDRDQDDLVHAVKLARVEREPVVIEVEEAALEAHARPPDMQRRSREGDADR